MSAEEVKEVSRYFQLMPEQRERVKQRARQWQKDHPERVRTRSVAYYAANKPKMRERARGYYQINKDNYKSALAKFYTLKPWYRCYQSIVQRCENTKCRGYRFYGGRGIECRVTQYDVQAAWFRDKAWLLKRPSIDRIDSDGHYEYDNIRFIELSENCRKGVYDKIKRRRRMQSVAYANERRWLEASARIRKQKPNVT